jgi:hypothetical protein
VDPDERIVASAQRLAGKHKLTMAVPKLVEHLKSRSTWVSATALRALVDTLAGERLREIGPHLGPQDPPAPIVEDLARNLNLDDALAFLASVTIRSHTCTWLLDRVIESTPTHAWTEDRLRALMAVLAITGLQTEPDYAALGNAIVMQLDSALAAVRLMPAVGSAYGWYIPYDQGAALLAVDPFVLAGGNPTDELQDALEATREQQAERARRQQRHNDSQAEVERLIDRDGDQVDLNKVVQHGALRRLDATRRAVLARAVDRTWPTAALASGDLSVDHVELDVGAEISAPIAPDRWWQLLDAYVSGDGLFAIRLQGVGLWLSSTQPHGIGDELCTRIRACAGTRELRRLLIVGDIRDMDVADAACERLLELDVDERDWLASARYLAESSTARALNRLLDHAGAVRGTLVAVLARKGDARSRLEIIDGLTTQVMNGEDPEPPMWPNAVYDSSFCAPFTKLAHAAPTKAKVLPFAINGVAQISDASSYADLERLAAQRRIWWIELEAAYTASRLATTSVLLRLDDSVVAAAQAFGNL